MSLEDDKKDIEEALGSIQTSLQSIRRSLEIIDELNSSFPYTKEFLAARGVTRVSQLDEQGKFDLQEHLRITLRNLLQ